jgi:ketosteroid isomerase-like protein
LFGHTIGMKPCHVSTVTGERRVRHPAEAAVMVTLAVAEHPTAARVREALEAFNRGDFETLGTFLADDVVWHVGGSHELSGDYRGRDAALAYCAEAFALAGGTLHGEPFEILVSERHAGVFNRITGKRNGRMFDGVFAQAIRFDDNGRWAEYWALADEQDEVDDFWMGSP